MRGWWRDLTDLVLPAECGGCGTPRTVLCPECRAALTGAAPCRVRPVPEPAGLSVVHAAAPYGDEVRAMLLAHKERGALALAAPLGAALAGAVRAGLGPAGRPGPPGPAGRPVAPQAPQRFGKGDVWGELGSGRRDVRGERAGPGGCGTRMRETGAGTGGVAVREAGAGTGGVAVREAGAGRGPVLLVPVPSARWAVRARGHDPVRRIALAAARELRRSGTPARVLGVLRQRRAVADQSGLNSRQRAANLAGALEVVAGGGRLLAEGGRVVLVDDLMTTGASLAEAARAVRTAQSGVRALGWTGERTVGAEVFGRIGGREHAEGRSGDMVCSAVIAAPPDAFEINRN
ncbi:ComF family protein [Streptomyces sp. NPDC056738]|uniref:ComF family protein n=1 Tax=Streptomyces sp. NPDC056738 TaxID=3345933 RepID=UPI00368DFAC6